MSFSWINFYGLILQALRAIDIMFHGVHVHRTLEHLGIRDHPVLIDPCHLHPKGMAHQFQLMVDEEAARNEAVFSLAVYSQVRFSF